MFTYTSIQWWTNVAFLGRRELSQRGLFASAVWWRDAFICLLLLLNLQFMTLGNRKKKKTSNTDHNLFAFWRPLIINNCPSISLESHSWSPKQLTQGKVRLLPWKQRREGLNSEQLGSHPTCVRWGCRRRRRCFRVPHGGTLQIINEADFHFAITLRISCVSQPVFKPDTTRFPLGCTNHSQQKNRKKKTNKEKKK